MTTYPQGAVERSLSTAAQTPEPHHMSHIDGCPECVLNTESPRSIAPVIDGHRCAYLCADCGHAWTTDWKD